MRLLVIVSALALASGCAGLLIQPYDSPATKTGKVAARVLIAVPTFGTSEIRLDELGHAQVQREVRRVEVNRKRARMDALIGELSYDDSLIQWGAPQSVADGEKVRVATWSKESSRYVTRTSPRISSGGSACPKNSPYACFEPPQMQFPSRSTTQEIRSSWELRLVFDLETMLLKDWHETTR